ncbi:14742_t:CDS:2, partial [Gigaspora margarita]
DNRIITDEELCQIAQSYNKLEYLNISYCNSITNKSLIKITISCYNLREFYFNEAYWITNRTVSYILNSYSNLRCLDIWSSHRKIKDASILLQMHLKLEYLDFTHVMAFRNFIVAIVESSSNLKYFDISGNDIGDKVVETVASICHKLEYLDFGGCGFITKPSVCNIIQLCPKFQHLELGFCNIFDKTIKEIACLCPNLKYLDLDSCEKMLIRKFGSKNTSNKQNLEKNPMSSYLPPPNPIFTSIFDESDFISAFKSKKSCEKKVLSSLKQLIEELLTNIPIVDRSLEETSYITNTRSIFLQLSDKIDSAKSKNKDVSNALITSYFYFGEALYNGAKTLVKSKVRKEISKPKFSNDTLKKQIERARKMFKIFNTISKEKIVQVKFIPQGFILNFTVDNADYVIAKVLKDQK